MLEEAVGAAFIQAATTIQAVVRGAKAKKKLALLIEAKQVDGQNFPYCEKDVR